MKPARPYRRAAWMCVGLVATLCASAGAQGGRAWPAATDHLLFAYAGAQKPVFARGPDGAALYGYALVARGKARTDAYGRLLVREGRYVAPHIGDTVASSIRASQAFTVEVRITPDTIDQDDAVIVAIGGMPPEGTLALVQDGDELRLRMRSTEGVQDIRLFRFSGAVHLTVAYDGDKLSVYRDGQENEVVDVRGALVDWEPAPILLGAATAGGDHDWAGTLEAVSLYRAALGAEAIEANFRAYRSVVVGREAIPTLRVRATLAGTSHVPEPEELAPYTESLSVYQYSVEDVLEGEYDGETLYVAHWGVLDAEQMPFKNASIGATYTLDLQPFESNPQLETVNIRDDVVEDFSIPWFYDAGGLSLGFGDVSERGGGE